MKLPKLYAAVILLSISLFACNKGSVPVNGAGNSDRSKFPGADQLIAKGYKYANSTPDSLPDVADELYKEGTFNNDHRAILMANYFEAWYYWQIADHPKAMKSIIAALNQAEQWGIKAQLPAIYSVIGNLHKENSNYPLAMQAADRGLTIAKANNDTDQVINLLGLKAMFIHSSGLYAQKASHSDKSIGLHLQALQMTKASPKFERTRIKFYDNISQYYKDNGDFKNAVLYGDSGVVLAKKYNKLSSLTYSYCWLGQAYYQHNEHTKGLEYLNEALALTRQLKLPYREMELYDHFSNSYQSSGDFEKALMYASKSRKMHDSLQVITNAKQLSELQLAYDAAKKDKTIAGLNQMYLIKSQQIVRMLIGSSLFAVIFIAMIFQYSVIRRKNALLTVSNQKINEQSAELQNLMKELHHRVKNNLQIVSSLLSLQSNRLTDEDARNAFRVGQQRIEAMSLIHRSLYQQENPTMVNMREYITDLIESIMQTFGIEGSAFDLHLDIKIKDLHIDTALPLGLIINEWVTNAFKHAYTDGLIKPALWLKLNESNKIELEIKDNGPGMPLTIWNKPQKSFGIKLVKVLTKQLRGECDINTDEGTKITLLIPLNNQRQALSA